MIKKLLTHSFLYSIAPQVPKVASLLLMPVMTQHLKPFDYGVYGVIASYLFFVAPLKDLGFGVVFVNTFYKYPNRWQTIWKWLHGHLVFWSVVYAAIMVILLKIAVPEQAESNALTIGLLVVIPALFFDNTITLGNYYFRFSEKPLFVAIVSVVTTLSAVSVTYYCVVVLNAGYMSWFISSFVASLIMFLFYAYPVYGRLKLWPVMRWRKRFILPHLRVSLPVIPHNYSVFLLNSADRVILDMYKIKIPTIGLYNVAYQFGGYFDVIGEGIGLAVGPYYSKLYFRRTPKAEEDARLLTFFLSVGFLLATFLTAVWLKEIFILLIRNNELRVAYDIGILIIMGYAYRPLYWCVANKLAVYEKTSMLWRVSFVAGILNVVLNVIFVPFYGIYASAVSTLIALLYMGFAGFFMKSYKKIGGLNYYPAWWLGCICILTTVAYGIRDQNYLVKVLATVVALLAAMTWTKKNFTALQAVQI